LAKDVAQPFRKNCLPAPLFYLVRRYQFSWRYLSPFFLNDFKEPIAPFTQPQ